jgi:hypothetical protein
VEFDWDGIEGGDTVFQEDGFLDDGR